MPKPDKAQVDQVSADVMERLQSQSAPEGAAAAPADFAKKFGKLVPRLVTVALEVAAIGADGQVSADEVKAIAGSVFEFIRSLRKPAAA